MSIIQKRSLGLLVVILLITAGYSAYVYGIRCSPEKLATFILNDGADSIKEVRLVSASASVQIGDRRRIALLFNSFRTGKRGICFGQTGLGSNATLDITFSGDCESRVRLFYEKLENKAHLEFSSRFGVSDPSYICVNNLSAEAGSVARGIIER